LKRVTGTGRIFTINKCFHRSKPKLYSWYLNNKAAKKLKTIGVCTYTKSTDMIFRTSKNYSPRDIIPLRAAYSLLDTTVRSVLFLLYCGVFCAYIEG
jgi:hypothetical protein